MAVKSSLKHLYLFVAFLSLSMKPALEIDQGMDGNGVILCKERERQALLKMKDELIDNYGYLASWGSEEDKVDCCKWRGITCSNQTGHVTKLDLFTSDGSKPLRGKLNQWLLELRHLMYLNLGNNNFNGTISSILANVTSLQSLDLSNNHFLDLGNSEWLLGLSSLRDLDLSYNPLIRPSDWLKVVNSLPQLEVLYLRGCFTADDILDTLSPLNSSSSLRDLDLSDNFLVVLSLYPWLSNITLQGLYLSNNILQASALADLGNIISLQQLSLINSTLVGGIPKSFANLSELSHLDLSRSNLSVQLSELIQNLSGKSLIDLDLSRNQITGSLPDFTRFSSLINLNLAYNRLNGTLNKSISRLSKLRSLDLGRNSLYGVITQDFFSNLSELSLLRLSDNSITLNMSLDWVPPFRLYTIYLRSCKLGPHFPKWLQTQNNYYVLDVSNNGISDSVPEWFWDLSSMTFYLNLSHNNLSGVLPHSSSNFSAPLFIDLSYNHFHGPLPLPLFSSTQWIDLSNNKFSGSVLSLCQVTSSIYGYLDLSDNLLSGVVPDCFMHMQDIVFLDLANNNLSGNLPASIGSLSKLETLSLRNNSFFGELPLSLRNCTKLRFVDLSGNKFSGAIFTWIGESISSLAYLSLQSNQFHGSISLQVCQLSSVQILDLSVNNINGTIPHCLKNLSSMSNGNSTKTIGSDTYAEYFGVLMYPPYINEALLLWKGRKYMIDKNLGLFRIIDLSSNKIEGEIPREIWSLSKLNQLNLSNNRLTGSIPQDIGNLKELESLDLSQNRLSGRIPTSMVDLNFLNTLNLSYNNLSGRIPSSTQLQSFSASTYTGNPDLCGLPISPKCPGDGTPQVPPTNGGNQDDQANGDEFKKWFYAGLAMGFSICFLGLSGGLLFNSS